jgi:hypothetical protein
MGLKKLAFTVLGAFLILSGLLGLFSGLGQLGIIIPYLAIAAGVLIIVSSPGISNFIGWIVAAAYLILLGLMDVIGFSFSGIGLVMAILALVAGILLLIKMPKIASNIGFFLFCVWLILVGISGLINLGQLGVIISLVAIISGILLILNK